MNLFGNALKYTKRGHISVSLRVDENHPAGQEKPCIVKLAIQDTGQGISPEYLRTKIFTPFSQENAKAAGAGLGLSIVRAIVNMLQGEIDIKSIVNMGTIVTVTLREFRPILVVEATLTCERQRYRERLQVHHQRLQQDIVGQKTPV